MRKRSPKLVLLSVVALGLGLTAGLMPAQQPPPPAAANGPEVLSRGPVHEAYADTSAISATTPLVTKQPPADIEEMPPDHKPDGTNVQWIPGYWHWDEDRKDYSWISGFWRSVPPGRVWVPGSWRGAPNTAPGQDAWQWVPGVWQEAPAPQQVQQAVQHEMQYLPEPPATLERGPTIVQPTQTSFYAPGCWVWRGDHYAWQPGYWLEYRTGWVWVPPHYRWSPIGYIYVPGYWDYPLNTRGVLYSPIGYNVAYVQPGYVYTPTYVVSDQCMMGAMFVRRGWGCYYFGDYYGPTYATGGYTAWCGTVGAGGTFVVGFGVGAGWGYDPLWSYYAVAYRGTPGWRDGMSALYVGRFNGSVPPPPITLVQQNIYINRVTNVGVVNVNNYAVVQGSITVGGVNISGMAMVAPTRIVADMHPEMHIQPFPEAARRQEMTAAREMRNAAAARMRAEKAVVDRGGRIPKPGEALHTTKVEVPHTAIARAQVHDEKKAPPVNPHAAGTDHGTPARVEPKGPAAKIDPKGPAPKVDPKHDPKVDPKHDPKDQKKNDKP